MMVLIIGYGSIGRKHYEVLFSNNKIDRIDIVTKQDLPPTFFTYKSLFHIEDLSKYHYFIIASETNKHYDQLKYICSKVSQKKILVEKPLFKCAREIFNLNKNNVFVAYNLRYHPVLREIKKILENDVALISHVYCGQFLPNWRPGTDYTDSYSASEEQGGGVLRDLSHEIDYTRWLFGYINNFSYISDKISDLNITSDDVFSCLARAESGVFVNLSIDYLSKKSVRSVIIHFNKFSIYADLINNTIENVDAAGVSQLKKFECDKLDTYRSMHDDILFSESKYACKFDEGYRLLRFFGLISNNIQNNGELVE